MKNIELFWNIVYYGIYRFDVRLSGLVGYINPFYWIHKIRNVKKYYASHGFDDMNKLRSSVFNNPKTGIIGIRTGGLMGGLIVLIEFGLFNIFEGLSGRSLTEDMWKNNTHFVLYLVFFIVPVILINNRLLFRKDKYLDYFKEFDKMAERKKVIYGWLSFFVVILIVAFFSLSFLFLGAIG